jgi:hypothetical protein
MFAAAPVDIHPALLTLSGRLGFTHLTLSDGVLGTRVKPLGFRHFTLSGEVVGVKIKLHQVRLEGLGLVRCLEEGKLRRQKCVRERV